MVPLGITHFLILWVQRMETNDLKKYLKEIITLESAVFEYSQYIAVAEKNAIYREPKKKEYEKPKLLQYEYEPSKETEVITSELIGDLYCVLLAALCLALMITAGIFKKLSIVSVLTTSAILFVIGLCIVLLKDVRKKRKNKARTISEIASVNSKNRNMYNDEMDKYNKYNKKYEAECEKEHQRSERAKDILGILETQFDQIDSILKKYYDMDVIFPKYRNFSAVCSFYEYLMTERCTGLTGPNGAYNLYESEKTMGHIVNAVDNIANMTAEALNMMKENQYYYYTEMRAINDHLNVFALQLDKLLTSGANANDYFMQIANNTKDLTYDSASILANMHI